MRCVAYALEKVADDEADKSECGLRVGRRC